MHEYVYVCTYVCMYVCSYVCHTYEHIVFMLVCIYAIMQECMHTLMQCTTSLWHGDSSMQKGGGAGDSPRGRLRYFFFEINRCIYINKYIYVDIDIYIYIVIYLYAYMYNYIRRPLWGHQPAGCRWSCFMFLFNFLLFSSACLCKIVCLL